MAIGFIVGTVLFGMANHWLKRRYGLDSISQKNSIATGLPKESKNRTRESPAEIVIIGTFLDSVPENIYISELSLLLICRAWRQQS
jgi:hypothetical protein